MTQVSKNTTSEIILLINKKNNTLITSKREGKNYGTRFFYAYYDFSGGRSNFYFSFRLILLYVIYNGLAKF